MQCFSEKDSFALFQYPNSSIIYLITGSWEKIDSEKLPKNGFIIFNLDGSEGYVMNSLPGKLEENINISVYSALSSNNELKKEEYLSLAKKFRDACLQDLQKVILSRKKIVSHNQTDIFKLFKTICQTYNHSFNYLLNIPSKGMWLGATPEKLINGKNNQYSTVSLAGSKNISADSDWSAKEYEEQAFVTTYIEEQLKKHHIVSSHPDQPQTIVAGNIHHLQTPFTITSEHSPIVIANTLHPTPAICGIPQQKALDFILKNEGYNREFYTGYLGFTNSDETNLFVNLRCMKIGKNTFELFIGGGITKDSVPEKEWEETELKAQTLLSVIEKM